MCKSAYVGVYQLLNWKMHGETLKNNFVFLTFNIWYIILSFFARHENVFQ